MEGESQKNVVSFEEALDEAGFGWYSYMLTGLTGLAIISFTCIVYNSTIIVPASACDLDLTGAQQGLLMAAPVIGVVSGATIWGYLGDTRGRRSMLMASILSGTTVSALSSISVNWVMLMVLQLFASFLASGIFTLSMTLVSESVPMMKRNLVMLLVASIFLLSQGIMAVLAIPILPLTFSFYLPALGIYWNSWRTVIAVYSIPSLITAILLIFMHESPKYMYENKKDEKEALKILKAIHRLNGNKDKFQVQKILQAYVGSTTQKSSVKDQIVPLFKFPLLKYTLIMILLYVSMQPITFMMLTPTIINYLVDILQSGEGSDLTLCGVINEISSPVDDTSDCKMNSTALLMVFSVGALQSLVNFLLSLVIYKTGRRNMAIALIAITGTFGISVNLIPNALASSVFFMVFLLGIAVYGLYTAIVVSIFPTHLRAIALAFTMTFGRIGTFVWVQILNFLIANHCNAGFYFLTALFTSSAIIASFLPDDRLLPPSQDTQQNVSSNELVTEL